LQKEQRWRAKLYFHEKWRGWKIFYYIFLLKGNEKLLRWRVVPFLFCYLGNKRKKEPKEYRTYIRIRNPRRAISCL